MRNFPGPLCRGKTHKRDVVKYAKEMAMMAFNNQSDSFEKREAGYILWQVLAVMVQHNGVYFNTDIAEVLTSDLPEDSYTRREQSFSSSQRVSFAADGQCHSKHDQVATYRELLLAGKTQEALEHAVNSKIWGHALMLAYHTDQNVFSNIMERFNSQLNEDDSLLCLYQHLGSKRPSILDKKTRRWRKHLAIMISNPSKSTAKDSENIHALGASLESRGLIEAAHLCYILAGEGISKQSGTVLLGYSSNEIRPEFVDFLALQRTEIYEYAMSLKDENFIIKDFQPWKELYVHSLADAGFHNKAFRYCEKLVDDVLKHSTSFTKDMITRLHALSMRLYRREFIAPLLDMNGRLQQLLDLLKENNETLGHSFLSTSSWQTLAQQLPQQSQLPQEMPYEHTQNIDNKEVQNSTTMVPTMFVPQTNSDKVQEQVLYREDNKASQSFAQFEPTAAPSGNMSYTGEFQAQEPVPSQGNYPCGVAPTDQTLPPENYPYENVAQAVPSSIEHDETGLPSSGTNFYEGDSFEHLLRKQPSNASVNAVETSGISAPATSDNSFDYYAQSNFRESNIANGAKKEETQAQTKEEKKTKKDDNKKSEKQSGGLFTSFGGFLKSFIPKRKNEIILFGADYTQEQNEKAKKKKTQ
ncbi:protein transport protein Sec16A-like [Dendronephthya gigantea]|uniref:protein transport protein Sec16A-like n=1 Tax=Dendronephthya gigantea TaxID=151771 RepID=UPI00106C410E|nr:protein transport protein Sec16A-like [Dendronephthya gigantea]